VAANCHPYCPFEDFRDHSPEQLAELHLLLNSGVRFEPIRERGFFEIDGHSHVLYVCKYPNGKKVLLIVAWKRRQLPQDPDAANP
jgi:hypothetical protein